MKRICIDSRQTFCMKLVIIVSPLLLIMATLLLYMLDKKVEYLLLLIFIPFEIGAGIYLYKKIKKEKGFLFTTDGVFVNGFKYFILNDIQEIKKHSLFEYKVILKSGTVYDLVMTNDQFKFIKESFNL